VTIAFRDLVRTERPAPPVAAPARHRHTVGTATHGPGRRPARKLAAGLALLVVGAWLISSFWVSVQVRSPRQPFVAPTASQPWLGSPEPGMRAFFRLRLPIPVGMPQTVTLWVEAFEQITVYVDGNRVAVPLVAPNKTIDAAPDIPKVVQTIDIRSSVTPGDNTVGLEVVSLDGRRPAFRARVEAVTAGVTRTYGVAPTSWRTTTDAALTGQELPESGAFSKPHLDDGSWPTAVRSSSRPETRTVSVAPDAFTRPATAPALIGALGTRTLVASRTVVFPEGCTEGWLRVAATGSYTVSLDGRTVATGSPPTGSSTLPMSIFDLCPVASPGRHVLSIAVSSSSQPLAYVDGWVRSGSVTDSFASGQGWSSGYSVRDVTVASQVATVNGPETDLGVVFVRTVGTTTVPPGPLLADHLLLTVELLAVAALAVLAARVLGVTLEGAVSTVLCGALPAVGLVLLLTETRHLVYVQPPFPSTPDLLVLVLVTAALGVVAMVMVSVRAAGRRPPAHGATAVEASAPDPDGAASSPRGVGRSPRSVHSWLAARWYRVGVVATAVGWSLVQSYHIMFNPLWQDELSSLAAAQGMRAHLLPEWPSGFLYWKSELYTALIAVLGGLTHDDPSVLREFSVLWFGATVAVMGLGLMPLVLPGRRVWQLVATVVFATAPFEMGHAQDIRMYQMLQCVVVVVALLLVRALRRPTTGNIAWLMAAVVAMYLTHEESFGVLVVIPLALCCAFGLRWVRNWRWFVFGGAAVALICVQLALAKFTHPPIFGIDPSGGPLIEWSPQPFYYFTNFFFTDPTYGSSITVVSSLAVVGVVVGCLRRDALRLLLAAFWIVPTAVVSLVLLTKDTRYAFLTLPFVFALAAAGTSDLVGAVGRVATRGIPRLGRGAHRVMVGILAVLVTVAVMLSLIGGLNDYGTLTMRLFNANVVQRQLDYPTAVAYVKAHWKPGDIVIAASSANLVGYSLGRAPNFWIPPHRTETLLYVFEKNDEAVDTQYGIPTILNADDFETALNSAPRVWLIGEDSVIRSLLPSMRTIVQSRFSLQEEGVYVCTFLATNT
jgi:hypothetical protein